VVFAVVCGLRALFSPVSRLTRIALGRKGIELRVPELAGAVLGKSIARPVVKHGMEKGQGKSLTDAAAARVRPLA
jgi:hypothetical protein